MTSKKAAFIVLLVLASVVSAWPQFQGKVAGRVLDPAGTPVEKAEVTRHLAENLDRPLRVSRRTRKAASSRSG